MFTTSTSATICNRKINEELFRKTATIFIYLVILIVVSDLGMVIVFVHRLHYVFLQVDHRDVLNLGHHLLKYKAQQLVRKMITKKYEPSRLGRHPLTVRPRSTSTTTRRPSILRPSARLYAAESEVLTVNTTKYHRRFDHGFFFLPQSTYPHCLSYIQAVSFLVFQGKRIEVEKNENPPLFSFKKGIGLQNKIKCKIDKSEFDSHLYDLLLPFYSKGVYPVMILCKRMFSLPISFFFFLSYPIYIYIYICIYKPQIIFFLSIEKHTWR